MVWCKPPKKNWLSQALSVFFGGGLKLSTFVLREPDLDPSCKIRIFYHSSVHLSILDSWNLEFQVVFHLVVLPYRHQCLAAPIKTHHAYLVWAGVLHFPFVGSKIEGLFVLTILANQFYTSMGRQRVNPTNGV